MSKNLYIDLHVIQTLPPSCVNRDDTGSPKTAIYGGVTRARVSSQSWKRAMRLMFADMYTEEEKGIRTKKIVDLLAKKISELDSEIQSAEKLAKKVLEAAGIKLTEKNPIEMITTFIELFKKDTMKILNLSGVMF